VAAISVTIPDRLVLTSLAMAFRLADFALLLASGRIRQLARAQPKPFTEMGFQGGTRACGRRCTTAAPPLAERSRLPDLAGVPSWDGLAFIIPGDCSILWLIVWRSTTGDHRASGDAERQIFLRAIGATAGKPRLRWRDLLKLPQTWNDLIRRPLPFPFGSYYGLVSHLPVRT